MRVLLAAALLALVTCQALNRETIPEIFEDCPGCDGWEAIPEMMRALP
jgi:hypothetical protein